MGYTVRPLQVGDIDAYLRMFSYKVRAALHVDTVAAERVYLQECLQLQSKGLTHFYVICADEMIIGALEIRNAIYSFHGQLYCWLHEYYWGSGIFKQACLAVAQDYFFKTGDYLISAYVDYSNPRSFRALQKVGFAHSGITFGAHGIQYELLLRRRD